MAAKRFNRMPFNRPPTVTVRRVLQVAVQYAVQVVASTTKTVRYCITVGTSAVQLNTSYVIKVPEAVSVGVRYCIRATASKTRCIRGFNRKHFNRPTCGVVLTLQISTQYAVRSVQSAVVVVAKYTIDVVTAPITVPVEYAIKTGVQVGVGVRYCVRSAAAVTKSVGYRIVVGTRSVAEQIQYCVRRAVGTAISVGYAITASGAITIPVQYVITPVLVVHEYELWTQQIAVATPPPFSCEIVIPYNPLMAPDFSDIRFSDAYEGHMYAATRVSYTPSTTATFLVEVPTTSDFWMYFGNTKLAVQNEYVNPSGAVSGSPSGTVSVCLTFLWRYVIANGGA